VRRPSFATVIALMALFVALGGPARAVELLRPGSVTSKAIKDRTVQARDLKRKTLRWLRETRNNSITEAKLANRSVTPGKLAVGAVGSPALADRAVGTVDLATGSVTGVQVADGLLSARDLGRYWGRFRVQLPAIRAGRCWSAEPKGLAPERARADISQDLVLVTPDSFWQDRQLAFTVSNSGLPSRFVLSACAFATSAPVEVGFRYLVIDLP
jgi:hypothetical protein